MATTNVTPIPANGNPRPQQPDLRSFIVMDQLPPSCVSYEVESNEVTPHLRTGDFAVIDTSDREPVNGELYLIEWQSGRRQLVEVRRFARPECLAGWDGVTEYWSFCWWKSVHDLRGNDVDMPRWQDGPYRTECATSRIVGQVVGIYQPDFRKLLLPA